MFTRQQRLEFQEDRIKASFTCYGYCFLGMFLLIGVTLIGVVVVGRGNNIFAVFIGAVFMLASLAGLLRPKACFDLHEGLFYPKGEQHSGIPLSSLTKVQLELEGGSGEPHYYLRVIDAEGKRCDVLNDGILKGIREDGQRLAEMLGVPYEEIDS